MFEKYNPLHNKILRIINTEGKIINQKDCEPIDDKTALKAYKDMLFARITDQMAVSFQRQGRMFTYPPNYGQEAISVATGMVMREDDWLVPAFREMAAYFAKGATPKDLFLYFMGYEEGNTFAAAKNILPISVPISSQLPHAVGIGYSINYNKTENVVFTFVGDGGTSEGDFHEALNFAGVWKVPVIFIIQNNQFAISVPVAKQTASVNLAVKGIAHGVPAIKVDGNDLFAMYSALKFASEYARAGNGPVLIEALTYRLGAHTTSDDPTKYRAKDEEVKWEKTDPIYRLKNYLFGKKIWSQKDEDVIIEQYRNEIDRQFAEAEAHKPYQLDDVFNYMYKDIPIDLLKQKNNYENFLKWKEGRK